MTDETLVAINKGDAFLGSMMEATSYEIGGRLNVICIGAAREGSKKLSEMASK